MKTKWCPGCKQDLPFRKWGKRRASPDGLQYRCRECMRRAMAAHRELKREAADIARERLAEEFAAEYEAMCAEVLAELKQDV